MKIVKKLDIFHLNSNMIELVILKGMLRLKMTQKWILFQIKYNYNYIK